jgi:hypothetical protein
MKPGTRAVLDWLRIRGERGGTHLEALDAVGTSRLAARVWEIRQDGYEITETSERTPAGARISRYCLHEAHPVQLDLFGPRITAASPSAPSRARRPCSGVRTAPQPVPAG